jgi:RNA polymerase sigma factor for flagellar operon FliA
MPQSGSLGAPTEPTELALKHQDLVRILAAKLYRQRWSDEVPFDDYYQSGMVGLLEAAGRFDASRGFLFSSFATPRIVGSILNSLESATERNRQIAAHKQMASERAASVAEAGSSGGSAEDALVRIADIAIGLAIGFMLEGSGLYSEGDELSHCDGYRSLACEQTAAALRKALACLPERQRELIELHYFGHMPFKDIAARVGLTKGRISQLHAEALKTLRRHLGETFSDFET